MNKSARLHRRPTPAWPRTALMPARRHPGDVRRGLMATVNRLPRGTKTCSKMWQTPASGCQASESETCNVLWNRELRAKWQRITKPS